MTSLTKSWLVDILALTLIIGLFYSIFLGTRPLMAPDEGRYAEIAREMVVMDDYITPHLNGIKYLEKPPLFYWIESLSIKTMGLNETTLRVAPLLIGLLGCLVTYSAARKLYNRRSALLAACILATSSLYYITSHLVILDILLTVCLACSLFCFILGVREPPSKTRNFYMWGMYVSSALAVLTKGLIAILFPCLIIFSWLLIFNEWRQLKHCCVLSGIFIFLVITVPWHGLVQIKNPEFFHFYFIEQHFTRYLTHFANHEEPFWFFIACILLGFFPWAGFLVQSFASNLPRNWKQRFEYKEPIFLILWIALIFLFFTFSRSKLVSYITPIFPALAILTGHYFDNVWEHAKKKKSAALGFIIILIMGLGGSLAAIIAIEAHVLPLKIVDDVSYVYISFVLLILLTLIPVWLFAFSHIRTAFISLCIFTCLFLLSLNLSYPVVSSRSAKSLALTVKPLLQKDNLVIVYHAYYPDLPVYLENKVMVIDWLGELGFGAKHQKDASWMVPDPEFFPFWKNSKKQLYMVMNQKDYHILRSQNMPLYLLAETPRYILVTNKSTRE